jgi:chromosome segregation ATPase
MWFHHFMSQNMQTEATTVAGVYDRLLAMYNDIGTKSVTDPALLGKIESIIDSADTTIASLTSKMMSSTNAQAAQISNLKGSIQELSTKLAASNDKINALKALHQQAVSIQRGLETKLSGAETSNADLSAKMRNAQTSIDSLNRMLRAEQTASKASAEEVNSLKAQLQSISSKFKSLEKAHSTLKDTHEGVRLQLNTTQKSRDELAAQLSTARSQTSNVQKGIGLQLAEAKAAQQKIAALLKEETLKNMKLQDEIKALDLDRSTNIQKLRAQNEADKSVIATLQQELENLRVQRLTSSNAESDESAQRIAALTDSVQSLQAQIAADEATIMNLTQELEDSRNQSDGELVVSAITDEEHEQVIANLNAGLLELEAERRKLEDELTQVKTELVAQNEALEKSKGTLKVTLGVATVTTIGAFFLAQRMSAKS